MLSGDGAPKIHSKPTEEHVSMRACEQGYAGLEKLTALMNLPKPMTANNYDKIVTRLNVVAKEVANETMRDASENLLSKSKDLKHLKHLKFGILSNGCRTCSKKSGLSLM